MQERFSAQLTSFTKTTTKMQENLPGKNPGTSTNVISGMLKASQKRTKRAPFTEEFMSKQPNLSKRKNRQVQLQNLSSRSKIPLNSLISPTYTSTNRIGVGGGIKAHYSKIENNKTSHKK